MKERVKKIIRHPLIYGSAIVVFGNLLANFFNFLYNLFMSRNLSVSDYGTLASIVSIIGLPTLVSSAITPMVIKFAGEYFAKNNIPFLKGFYLKINKFYILIALFITIVLFIFVVPFGQFLHIQNIHILYITICIIFFAFMAGINGAFLQAKLAFGFQVIVSLVISISKLVIGAFLVFAGYTVPGATFSILLSGILGYIVSFIPLRVFIFDKKIVTPKIETTSLFSYGVPSALTSLGLTSFITADMILVKHFFDPVQAGLYAGLALVARVIFYISGPIGTVMFPVIIQKHSRNESFVNTFRLSVFFVLAPSIILTIIYYFFPQFVILFFLKKQEYLTVQPLLWLFGAYIGLYALMYILTTFYLSIKKTKVYIPVLSGALAQIVGISLFHENFLQIITVSLVIMFLLVIILLIYYPYATKK
jgi:O-antigen/teichoic acid export membrane protein